MKRIRIFKKCVGDDTDLENSGDFMIWDGSLRGFLSWLAKVVGFVIAWFVVVYLVSRFCVWIGGLL